MQEAKNIRVPTLGTLVQRTKQRRNALEPVSNCQVRHHRSAGGRDVRHGARPPWHGVLSVAFGTPQQKADAAARLLSGSFLLMLEERTDRLALAKCA